MVAIVLLEVTEYKLPFEDDLGIHPTMELMQERVVEKKLRPYIKEEWKSMQVDHINKTCY